MHQRRYLLPLVTLLAACGGGTTEVAPSDAGSADAPVETHDTGTPDATAPDSATPDAASEAATPDASPTLDAATDAKTGTLNLACSGAHPSFAADVQPIVGGSCRGEHECHGNGGFSPYASLVNAPAQIDTCKDWKIAVPNDLEASYILHKLTGIGICPSTTSMPPGGHLSATQIQTIADWICTGAPNN